MKSCLLLGSFLVAAWCASLARADHFTVELVVQAGNTRKSARAAPTGPGAEAKARSLIEVQAGQPITVRWKVTSNLNKEKVKDVLIHCFVVKEEKVGQAAVPKLTQNVKRETALVVDFNQRGDHAGGSMDFQIQTPGAYLVRVETIGGATPSERHEHYAAVDLVIK